MSKRSRTPRRILMAAATTSVLALSLAACGSDSDSGHSSAMPGMDHSSTPSHSASTDAMASMPGMDAASTGNCLASARDGYLMTSTTADVPAGRSADYRFTVTGPDGRPVTDFTVDQTKRMHFYAVRTDLTGFQHLHPTMAKNGTWTAPLASLSPGTWRLYASFTPGTGSGKGKDLVLSRTVKVPGMPMTTPLPKASGTTTADG